MNYIHSYLNEVSQYLPAGDRQDILSELKASIEEAVHERAESEHRAATDEDQKAVLSEYGHPIKVAAGYREQHHLIGPELFPTFLHTLKVVWIVSGSLQLVTVLAASLASDLNISLTSVAFHVAESLFFVSAIVVAVFAAVEYSGEQLHWYDSWKPEALSPTARSIEKRGGLVTNIVTEGIFLLWWNDVIVFQNWLPKGGSVFPLALSEAWQAFFWPLNVVVGAFLVLHVYVLLRGIWQRTTLISELVLNSTALVLLGSLLLADSLVSTTAAFEAEELRALQFTVKTVVIVIGAFCVGDLIAAWKQLVRPPRFAE